MLIRSSVGTSESAVDIRWIPSSKKGYGRLIVMGFKRRDGLQRLYFQRLCKRPSPLNASRSLILVGYASSHMHTQLERDSQGYTAALDVSRLFHWRYSHALETLIGNAYPSRPTICLPTGCVFSNFALGADPAQCLSPSVRP